MARRLIEDLSIDEELAVRLLAARPQLVFCMTRCLKYTRVSLVEAVRALLPVAVCARCLCWLGDLVESLSRASPDAHRAADKLPGLERTVAWLGVLLDAKLPELLLNADHELLKALNRAASSGLASGAAGSRLYAIAHGISLGCGVSSTKSQGGPVELWFLPL